MTPGKQNKRKRPVERMSELGKRQQRNHIHGEYNVNKKDSVAHGVHG
jgi:hypothetical protein